VDARASEPSDAIVAPAMTVDAMTENMKRGRLERLQSIEVFLERELGRSMDQNVDLRRDRCRAPMRGSDCAPHTRMHPMHGAGAIGSPGPP
jgi:hypothetical protein